MSYDLRILTKIEDTDLFAVLDEPELASPTYNLGRMFRACTGWDYEQGTEYRCEEVIDSIVRGINELSVHPGRYQEYEDPDGWGTIPQAKEALESLRDCIYENAETIPIKYLWVRW